MNDETKNKINERYQRELNRGELFWPDSIFKDAVVALGILILLIILASFIGVAGEPKADPSDTSYLPRPEWYFLFLFKFLALYGQIPVIGKIEWLATVVVPGIGIGLILLLPFIDRSQDRYYTKRALPLTIMGVMVVDIILLTLIADVPTAFPETANLGWKLAVWLQPVAGLVIPAITMLVLGVVAKYSKGASWKFMAWFAGGASVIMVGLAATILALYSINGPKTESTEAAAMTLPDQILAGQDLYSLNCVECHGDDGKVTTIEGVKGLEGKEIPAINNPDVLYTLNDAAMAEVIAYGRPNAGMNPFGKMYNPEGLSKGDIDNIVLFMRYMWDDRFETPTEVLKPLIPSLADSEVPSYDVHIAPLVKRYCISCHRAGKENNNFVMTSYDEILTTGDHADKNLVKGDANSYLLQVIQGHPILDASGEQEIGVMPPKSTLKPSYIEVFLRWILGGMPQTAAEASALHLDPTPTPAP
jgi:mono/diheme cytochrome c family protein